VCPSVRHTVYVCNWYRQQKVWIPANVRSGKENSKTFNRLNFWLYISLWFSWKLMWARLTSLVGGGINCCCYLCTGELVNRSVRKPQTSAIASIRDKPEHSLCYGKLTLCLPWRRFRVVVQLHAFLASAPDVDEQSSWWCSSNCGSNCCALARISHIVGTWLWRLETNAIWF